MFRCLAVVCASSSSLLLSPGATAKPQDIVSIERLNAVYELGLVQPSASWVTMAVDAGTGLRVERANAIARAGGYQALLGADTSELEEDLAGPVRRLAKEVARSRSGLDRSKKLQELLILSTEDSKIEEALARFLGFSEPGDLLGSKLKRAEPDFTRYATVQSQTDRLAIGKPQLLWERGGSGAGNKIPDAGEWVQVSMSVKNKSNLPYFSSSAWVKSNSVCAWAPPSREFEFPELRPGGSQEGTLDVWVYLSRTCADGASISLQISVRDTHRTRGGAHLLSVQIPVRNRLQHRAVALKLDRDVPGYSDGIKAKITQGGQDFEVSHGMRHNPRGFEIAFMGWGVDGAAQSLIEEDDFTSSAPMLVDAGEPGRLLPGDDYDVTTVEQKTFNRRVRELAREKKWVMQGDAHVVFATDVLLAYEDPQPPPEPKVVRPTRERNCVDGLDEDGDGAVDCDDSDCANYAACREPSPPDVDDVVSLVKATTRIEAQRTSIEGDDGIDAVNDHYELSFDEGTFARNYQCLIDEIPLDRCGETPCPSCKKVKVTAEKPAPKPPKRYVTYVHRTYFRVPVQWVPEPSPCDGVRCDQPPSPRCFGDSLVAKSSPGTCSNGRCSYPSTGTDCAASGMICKIDRCVPKPTIKTVPTVPLSEREHRIDVGYHDAAISAPTVEIESSELWETSDASTSEFAVRYSMGKGGLTYYGSLSSGSSEIASRGEDSELSTWGLAVGAGYLWSNESRRIELHPRAGLALLSRAMEIDEEPWVLDGTLDSANMDVSSTSVGLELGVSARGRISEGLGGYLDFSYMMQGAGPPWTAPNDAEILILSGSHSRFGGGVTILF